MLRAAMHRMPWRLALCTTTAVFSGTKFPISTVETGKGPDKDYTSKYAETGSEKKAKGVTSSSSSSSSGLSSSSGGSTSARIDSAALKHMEDNIFVFSAPKAGMDTTDQSKARIGKIIEEASKGSTFYNKQIKKLEMMKLRVQEKQQEISLTKSDPARLRDFEAKSSQHVLQLKTQGHDFSRTWIHLDMDMFFAAVEIRDNPSLAEKPLAVGNLSMISTTNYVARKFGVRSAMPGFIGRKLCPDLVFVPCRIEEYKGVSEKIMDVLRGYDKDLESLGMDEASLDVTEVLAGRGKGSSPESLAREMQENIMRRVGLTSSCGIGPNQLVAKISCGMKKPNGITRVPCESPSQVEAFMSGLSIREIPGIGNVSEQLLNGLSIYTCQDILERAADLCIISNFPRFDFYIRSALGIGRTRHELSVLPTQKSVQVSATFRAISELPEFVAKIRLLAAELEKRVAELEVSGRTVAVEVKTCDFETRQRSVTLETWVGKSGELAKVAENLLREGLWPCRPARLIGVRLTGLVKRGKEGEAEAELLQKKKRRKRKAAGVAK